MSEQNNWHLDKRVSIGVIVGVFLNIAGLVWATSSAMSDIENLQEECAKQSVTTLLEYRLREAENVNREILTKMNSLVSDMAVVKSILKNENIF